MKISDYMSRDVQLVDPQQTIRDVARLMAERDFGAMPVGENDRLVGMITDRDIAVRGVAQGKGPDAQVREVMTADVSYCFEDEDIDAVLHNMGERKLRRLPVLNREKRLTGIVSMGDLVAAAQPDTVGRAMGRIAEPGR